jgi:hypothetical protein
LPIVYLQIFFADIDKLYQEQDKDDYMEGIVDIYVALAAKALNNFNRAKQAPHSMPENSTEYSRKFVEYLKSADEKNRINEYTWLIKGFFEIVQGNIGLQYLAISRGLSAVARHPSINELHRMQNVR